MALFSGSRYSLGENSKKITATKITPSSGVPVTFLHDRKVYTLDDLLNPTFLHEVISGELLDLISFLNSGDSTKWWLIADINEMFYVDDEMDIGRHLQIPNIEDFRSL
jgi:hypothetical protein